MVSIRSNHSEASPPSPGGMASAKANKQILLRPLIIITPKWRGRAPRPRLGPDGMTGVEYHGGGQMMDPPPGDYK
jgi:hypothetical protein